MKRGARRARTVSYNHFMQDLSEKSEHDRLRTVSTVLKAKSGILRRNLPSTKNITPSKFTFFIANRFVQEGGLSDIPYYFQGDKGWEELMARAIKEAQKNKAVGSDEVFSELLQLTAEL